VGDNPEVRGEVLFRISFSFCSWGLQGKNRFQKISLSPHFLFAARRKKKRKRISSLYSGLGLGGDKPEVKDEIIFRISFRCGHLQASNSSGSFEGVDHLVSGG